MRYRPHLSYRYWWKPGITSEWPNWTLRFDIRTLAVILTGVPLLAVHRQGKSCDTRNTGAATDNTVVKTVRRDCWTEVVGFRCHVCFLTLLIRSSFVGRYCLPARRLVLALSNDLNDFIIRPPPPLPPLLYLPSLSTVFCGRFLSRNGHKRPWPNVEYAWTSPVWFIRVAPGFYLMTWIRYEEGRYF